MKRTREEKFMLAALRQAKKGLKEGEVPIGAVVVYEDKVVGKGYNRRAKKQLATAHAEIMAIDGACRHFSSWRLPEGSELYVTLEPCPMCMGAALNSRVDKIYFGAKEQKGRSLTNELAAANLLNHTTEVTGGVLEKECSAILSEFFVSLRSRLKAEKEAREQAKKTAEEEKNAFRRDSRSLLFGFRDSSFAKKIHRFFHIAVGIRQRLFAIHHARAGFFAQSHYVFCRKRHNTFSPFNVFFVLFHITRRMFFSHGAL